MSAEPATPAPPPEPAAAKPRSRLARLLAAVGLAVIRFGAWAVGIAQSPVPSPELAEAKPRSRLVRLLAATWLAGLGFAAIWLGTWALGFGRDIHPWRVVATVSVLLLLVGVLDRRPRLSRAGIAICVLAAGTFAWWWVPPRLLNAVKDREELLRRMRPVQYEDVGSASYLQGRTNELVQIYPTLAEPLRQEFERWGEDAALTIIERIRETTPQELAVAELAFRQSAFFRTFPQYRKPIEDEYVRLLRRSSRLLIDELYALRPADWDGFNRSAVARGQLRRALFGVRDHVMVDEVRDELIAAEVEWVRRSTGEATEEALRSVDEKPEAVRALCVELDRQIRSLKSINAASLQFRSARTTLFLCGHDAAARSVLKCIGAGDYSRAFTIALRHEQDWLLSPYVLNAERKRALADLREHARHLAIRFEKAGFVDSAPAPRERETAPPPRSKH